MGLFGFIPFAFETTNAQGIGSTSVVTLDAGALSVAQPANSRESAAALSASVRRATAHTALSGSAIFIGSSDTSTATQATIGAEFALPGWASLRAEFSGTATIFGVFSSERGASRNGFVRPQIVRENFGGFATLGAGSVDRAAALRFHALSWDIGAWTRRGVLTGVVSAGRSFTNDFPLMEASNFFLSRPARHYAIQDAQANITALLGRFELQVTGISRTGLGATNGRAKALQGVMTTNLNQRFALTINGGKQLARPLSGAPTANIVGASLRLYLLGGDIGRGASREMAVNKNSSPFATRILLHATGGATVTVRVSAASDAQVELSGSFSEWAVVAVPRVGNAFELSIELPRGTHRLAMRINGGEWKAPAGLARTKDDLGGESGIVVVP
ncbi:MAG: glycogen-binding domain-containing protein [Gemmatimonas sp.]